MAAIIKEGYAGTPTIQRHRCAGCDARFEKTVMMDLPVEQVVAQWHTLRCPGCGAGPKKILMGESRRLSEDLEDRVAAGLEPDADIEERSMWWTSNGEAGTSSKTVQAVMTGGRTSELRGHPHDVDDLRRIMLLLDLVPEWRPRMGEMAAVSPEWKALAAVWEPIAEAYLRDCPDMRGASPDAHRLIGDALAGARTSAS